MIFTSVHVIQNFGHSNLRLLFKACLMIKHISRRYFTEGLAQTHRTCGLSCRLPVDSIGTFYLYITHSELALPFLSQLYLPLCADTCPLLLPNPVSGLCLNVLIFACTVLSPFCLSVCLSKLGWLSKTQLSHLLCVKCCLWPCSDFPQTLSKFMWSLNNAISEVEVFWQIANPLK